MAPAAGMCLASNLKNKIFAYGAAKNFISLLVCRGYSTPMKVNSSLEKPLVYSTSEAAKMNIADTLSLPNRKPKESRLWFEPYVISGSLFVFFMYFAFFREENDIDKMLSGKSDNKYSKLFELQMKLIYCQNNNLPTEKLKEEIENLKLELNI